MTVATRESQADINFTAFNEKLPTLLETHRGKFAVMHNAEIVRFFDSLGDAVRFGAESFGDDFSVQEVTTRNVNLGCHTYAVMHLPT